MAERDVVVDHTTLYRWVHHYAPELKKESNGNKVNIAVVGFLMKLISNLNDNESICIVQ